MMDPAFWNDPTKAQDIVQQVNQLKQLLEVVDKLTASRLDLGDYLQLLTENVNDDELESEVKHGLQELGKAVQEAELQMLLGEDYDQHNAILSLHPGAGGTESQDWAAMLMRMYLRYAEKKGFKTETWDYQPDPEAGIKDATFLVKGPYAYGFLKSESGVHRLVRLSPFDTSGRRHTSFASIEVLPEMGEDDLVEINMEDVRIDTYRASGAGGQHVNKTDSAVRITHLPTQIVVQCQNERSQHANKETAFKLLRARLYDKQRQEKAQTLAKMRGEVRDIAWGNQIRSYVFHPYSMVKDHRTNLERGNVQAVMDGEIDDFIEAYLRAVRGKTV